ISRFIQMIREAVALCIMISLSILYFDLMFYNGFEITERYGSEIKKILLGIDTSEANAQISD
ncbi:MAG: hypothetical protein WB511_07060, partial [Nitrososphaeraceae archaeon]